MVVYLEHMNRYSSEIAELLAKKGRTSKSLPSFLWNAVLNPWATFVYNYFSASAFWMAAKGCCCT